MQIIKNGGYLTLKLVYKKFFIIFFIAILILVVFVAYNKYGRNDELYDYKVINSNFLINPSVIMWNWSKDREDEKYIKILLNEKKKTINIDKAISNNTELNDSEKSLISILHKKYTGKPFVERTKYCNTYIDLSDVINTEVLKDAKIDIDVDFTDEEIANLKTGLEDVRKNLVININTNREELILKNTNKKYILKVTTNSFIGEPTKIYVNGIEIGKDCVWTTDY